MPKPSTASDFTSLAPPNPILEAALAQVCDIADSRNSIDWMRNQVGHLGITHVEDIAELRMIALCWMTAAAAEVARAVRRSASAPAPDRSGSVDVVIGNQSDLERCATLFPGRECVRVGDQVSARWNSALLLAPTSMPHVSWWLERATACGFAGASGRQVVRAYEPTPPPLDVVPDGIVVVFDPEDLDTACRSHGDAWVTLWGGELPDTPLSTIHVYGKLGDSAQHAWMAALVERATPDVTVTRYERIGSGKLEPSPAWHAGEVTVLWRMQDLRDHKAGRLKVRGRPMMWGPGLTGQQFRAAWLYGDPDDAVQERWLQDILMTRMVPGGVVQRLPRTSQHEAAERSQTESG